MASGWTQEALLVFLQEKGGRARNTDLIEHFKVAFPEEPEERAAVRKAFKTHVDNIAFVKTEGDVRYVCLKKKFRVCGSDAAHLTAQARELHLPGSGDGNDSQLRETESVCADGSMFNLPGPEQTGTTGQVDTGQVDTRQVDTGQTDTGQVDTGQVDTRQVDTGQVDTGQADTGQVDIGQVDTRQVDTGKVDTRQVDTGQVDTRQVDTRQVNTGQVNTIQVSTCLVSTRQVDTGKVDTRQVDTGQVDTGRAGLHPRDRLYPEGLNEDRQPGSEEEEEEEQEEEEEGEGGSRKHFLEAMRSSSPQLRRSMVIRSSVYLHSTRSDGDSASLVSSSPDEDRTSVTLDPLEHEWMMCASDGEWTRLSPLLHADPTLVLRKDFVTGFTCLHWAAKRGEPELMALLINFAKRHDVSVSVDVRSNAGYTPLHVAAVHNHMEVVKLLVGAYSADVEVRDHSGRKACQYLTDNVSVDIRDIIGAYERSDAKNADRRDGGRWRFSKVLQTNLKPLRLLDPNGCDSVDGELRPREKVLRRRSSLSRMKPKLQRLRLRTSQIVHSTTLHDTEEREGTGKGSFKSRPKTHFFG
ncbi:ankyrin repeat domain-containing protein SOWAHC-like isoform X2 [Anoplopoma fimbria]|uniref:ankyrin repeat domain-containing protein SOWAHC-like isoform X2 n=1 Tax=Anoplopoma fimbria TaxID=229290 RepID=UPI0023EC5336|nr:ankyrin repeat domain-containing protein SOWAHC-like isoform X2 [Anoplopoma fimbria]